MFQVLADVTLVVHFLFILFVVAGGLLVLRWRRVMWFHLVCVTWGVLLELGQWVCPLTPLENWARMRAGDDAYTGDFIEHYLLPVVYPSGLTPALQVRLGLALLAFNLLVYGVVWWRRR